MVTKRLTWAGTSIVAILGVFFGWRQVSEQLPPWSLYVVIGLVVLASALTYPYGTNDDGTTRRLVNVRMRGRGHQIAVSGGDGPANTGTMASTQKGNITLNSGLQVSYSELKQMTVDASRPVVLPEAREVARRVASEAAIRTIDDRSELLVQKVIDELNKNPGLFARWDDPRFLAALTSAQRSFAETGDEDLADTLARLVAGMAARQPRTRREILLRQAIDVAARLTTEHINALAVQMYLTRFVINEPYGGPEWIANSLDTLCKPYYGHMPDSPLDFEYMSSTGVCYSNQFHQYQGGPYQILHDRYINAMYPPLVGSDMQSLLADNPENFDYMQVLGVQASSPDDVVIDKEKGTAAVPVEKFRARLLPEAAKRILAEGQTVPATKLLSAEQKLRELVMPRLLTTDKFRELVKSERPELGAFLDDIERVGALNYHLHPVGLVLAQFEIQHRTPQLAEIIDAAIEDGGNAGSYSTA